MVHKRKRHSAHKCTCGPRVEQSLIWRELKVKRGGHELVRGNGFKFFSITLTTNIWLIKKMCGLLFSSII